MPGAMANNHHLNVNYNGHIASPPSIERDLDPSLGLSSRMESQKSKNFKRRTRIKQGKSGNGF